MDTKPLIRASTKLAFSLNIQIPSQLWISWYLKNLSLLILPNLKLPVPLNRFKFYQFIDNFRYIFKELIDQQLTKGIFWLNLSSNRLKT